MEEIRSLVLKINYKVVKMKKNVEKVLKMLGSLETQIRKEYKAEIIGVFGSYARGEQKQTSDVDIIVRFHKGATLFDFSGLADFLEERLHVKVDLVSEGGIRKELKEKILHEVVAI